MTFLKIGGAEMKSKCSRLGRRKMGKNEKLRNAQSHADPDMEKHLCDAVPAAVAASSVSREGCRRNRPCKGRPCRLVLRTPSTMSTRRA